MCVCRPGYDSEKAKLITFFLINRILCKLKTAAASKNSNERSWALVIIDVQRNLKVWIIYYTIYKNIICVLDVHNVPTTGLLISNKQTNKTWGLREDQDEKTVSQMHIGPKAKHDYASYHWLPRLKKAHSVSESIHQSAERVTSLQQSVDGDMWVAATVEGTSNTITPDVTALVPLISAGCQIHFDHWSATAAQD